MPTYEIEQYEIHAQKYRIEAEDEAHAIAALLDGQADAVDGSLEYIEICEDLGLPTEEYPELAIQLNRLEAPIEDSHIPSIRSVEQVATKTTTPEQKPQLDT